MEIVQVVGIGLVSAILAVTLKKYNAEFGMMVSICAGAFIFMIFLPRIAAVLELLKTIAGTVDTDNSYILIVLKIVGIAYISQFGADFCVDAGQTAIAAKIELAGKVMIMFVSTPVLFALLDLIQGMLA